MSVKIAVLGCGNMASAVVKSLFKHSDDIEFFTYTPTRTKAIQLAQEVNGQVITDLSEIQDCDCILIGCKPYQFTLLADRLISFDLSGKTIISIMAAVPIDIIQTELNCKNVIRLMPSIPMQLDEGISLLLPSDETDKRVVNYFHDLLKKSSLVLLLDDEQKYEQLTVISSSGPAYVYYLIHIFSQILVEWGHDEIEAKKLATKLFKGASTYSMSSSLGLDEQIANVTSKKGVTVEAINSFKESSFDELIKLGVSKALKRSDEISNEFRSI